LGLCYEDQGQLLSSLRVFEKAFALDETFEEAEQAATAIREQLETSMGSEALQAALDNKDLQEQKFEE